MVSVWHLAVEIATAWSEFNPPVGGDDDDDDGADGTAATLGDGCETLAKRPKGADGKAETLGDLAIWQSGLVVA